MTSPAKRSHRILFMAGLPALVVLALIVVPLIGLRHPATQTSGARATGGPVQSTPTTGIAFYTCSMHPAVKQHAPGTCPIPGCGMALIPVTYEEIASGEIRIDPQRRQLLGIRSEVLRTGHMHMTVRAAAAVTYPDPAFTDISLKYGGWITHLDGDSTGQLIHQGQPLLSIYSPELYTAEQEFLLTLQQGDASAGDDGSSAAHHSSSTGHDGGLSAAARERLRLWDLSEAQIAELIRQGHAQRSLQILAPVSGYLVEKNVVQGSAVSTGQRLMRIAPLDRVWVLADIFENDYPAVHLGQPVSIAMTYLPGHSLTGTVDYLYPTLDPATRTLRARIVLDNGDGRLHPGMYATVTIDADLGPRLLIPKSAVMYTGTRRLVFLDLGEGRLRPVPVTIGVANDTVYEVLGGVSAGERVVTSGTFLLDAESRIRSAEAFWGGDDAGQ